jgi:hypothetical protein
MKPLACFLFILVFIVITIYLLSLALIHVFSEKIKDTSPQSVVVHIHKKNGKKNKVLITNPVKQTENTHNHIEGFLGDTKCTSCSNLSGRKPLNQIITPPKNKNKSKSTRDKRSRVSSVSKSKNQTKKQSKKQSKNQTKNQSNIQSKKKSGKQKGSIKLKNDVNTIEGFSGDEYLLNYRNNFKKVKNSSKPSLEHGHCTAYNGCEYY